MDSPRSTTGRTGRSMRRQHFGWHRSPDRCAERGLSSLALESGAAISEVFRGRAEATDEASLRRKLGLCTWSPETTIECARTFVVLSVQSLQKRDVRQSWSDCQGYKVQAVV